MSSVDTVTPRGWFPDNCCQTPTNFSWDDAGNIIAIPVDRGCELRFISTLPSLVRFFHKNAKKNYPFFFFFLVSISLIILYIYFFFVSQNNVLRLGWGGDKKKKKST